MPPRFESLRETLLRAGIAPRHVRRYVRELSDHYDDLVLEEAGKGLQGRAAEASARTRLGSDDALAAPMLSRPELRSYAARYPWAAFGVAPLLILTGMLLAGIMIEGGFLFAHLSLVRALTGVRHPLPPDWLKLSMATWNALLNDVVPLAVAALLCRIAIGQRISGFWIALGIALICIIGGFYDVAMKWSPVTTRPDRLIADFALVPPFRESKLVFGLIHAAMNGVIAGALYWFWLRREIRHAADI